MSDTPDLREQLAAWLAGDLDDAGSAAIEARMASEPWVAQVADEMADLAMGLGQVDDVEPPSGFSARLRAGLAEEIGHELPATGSVDTSGAAGSAGAAAPDARTLERGGVAAADGLAGRERDDLAARRAARSGRGRAGGAGEGTGRGMTPSRIRTALAVAAGFAVLFIGSVTVLGPGSSDRGADDSADIALEAADEGAEGGEDASTFALEERSSGEALADAEMLQDSAEGAATESLEAVEEAEEEAASDEAMEEEAPVEEPAEAAADSDDADDAADSAAATGAAPAPAADGDAGPAVLDLGAIATDDATIRQEVSRHPAVERLLGRPAQEVSDLAAPFTDEVLRAEPFGDGTEPGACLGGVRRDAGQDTTPAVAALLQGEDGPLLAYALVRSSDGATADRVDVWLTNPVDCGVLAVVS